MDIWDGIANYLSETNYSIWSVIGCLEFFEKKCIAVTSENSEDIKAEFKHQLHLTSTHLSVNKKARDKATNLYDNVERHFKFKEVNAFLDRMDKKANETLFGTKTDLYGSEVAVQMIDKKLNSFQSDNSAKTMNNLTNPQIVSEVVQASNHQHRSDFHAQNYDQEDQEGQEDQEADDGELDGIVVKKISTLLFSNLTLEEIWIKVTERLKNDNLRVQSIESRIVDLSNWTKVEWNRILKASDYSQLFIRSRKKLCKDKIDKNVQQLLHNGFGKMRSLNDLESWKDKFINLASSEDARLTVGILEFFHLCLRREINVLVMQLRERDFIVKVLSQIIGFLIEEFDIGTFELNWIEKDSRSVTCRKRNATHEEYVALDPPTKKMDLIISLRNYKVELLPLEAGNTEGPMDDTKFREDHSKIKVVMKDCLDAFWSKLHFKKSELEEVFTMGIQVTGTKWTVYSLTYDSSENFYFFTEMATLSLPTTLSDMEDLLPSFLENLLAFRHTLIDLTAKIRKTAQKKLTSPSPPSSPLHETTDTPPIKKQKKDPFHILDNLY